MTTTALALHLKADPMPVSDWDVPDGLPSRIYDVLYSDEFCRRKWMLLTAVRIALFEELPALVNASEGAVRAACMILIDKGKVRTWRNASGVIVGVSCKNIGTNMADIVVNEPARQIMPPDEVQRRNKAFNDRFGKGKSAVAVGNRRESDKDWYDRTFGPQVPFDPKNHEYD